MLQLKAKVEIQAGLKVETFSLYLPSAEEPLGESQIIDACGMPSELYAIMLQKVVIADIVGVSASILADEQLEKACHCGWLGPTDPVAAGADPTRSRRRGSRS